MIVYCDTELTRYMREAVIASPERPVLVDRFLDNATEVDVDCISDGETSVVGAIMEHIEQAGIHSGDSACVIPSFSLSESIKAEITRAAIDLARELKVRGLMNIQFAVKDEQLYVIEVNPRASRTVPFVSKATGVSLAKLAAKVMVGEKLKDLGYTQTIIPPHFSVKEAVFPWNRFPGIDIVLGPEMKSTGEVMGIDADWGMAYAKSQISAFNPLPTEGNVFLSVADRDKDRAVAVARDLVELGFKIYSTGGTHARLVAEGIPSTRVYKVARAGPPERHRHDEKQRNPLHHQHPEHPRVPRRRDPDPLHRHRPKDLPRHQPLRRRSLREGDALAEGQGVHGEEHPGVSRLRWHDCPAGD